MTAYKALYGQSGQVEVVYFPLAMDAQELPSVVDCAILCGAVCAQDEDTVAHLNEIRAVSDKIVAFGSCAAVGNIMRFFVRGNREPQPRQATHSAIRAFVGLEYAILGCPPPQKSLKKLMSLLTSADKGRINTYEVFAGIEKLSCFDLLDDVVARQLCMGCGVCEVSCPTRAIGLLNGIPEFTVERCIRCGVCYASCPQVTKMLRARQQSTDTDT